MSGFFNDTNQGRIVRAVEALELIEKSALSNKAKPEEIADMLRPVRARITRMQGGAAGPLDLHPDQADQPPPQGGQGTAPWSDVQDMAQQAELHDLTGAMAIYLDRLTEALGVFKPADERPVLPDTRRTGG